MPPSPEFDLSWIWNLLNGVVASIQSWFGSLWSTISTITNTGQGIFSGLVAFGSQIWDAICKFAETIGSWISNAFKWIYNGFVYIAQWFSKAFFDAVSWVGSGIVWIGSQLYNFANWLYNGLVFIWNWLVNTVTGIWNAIVGWFSGIASAISGWWGSVVSGVNAWFTNLIKGIRQKILQTIIADVSIYFGWKSVERITQARDLKDGAFGVMGLVASPFVGYLFASIANGLIASPSTTPIQLVPEIPAFAYTPPAVSITTPTEKPVPTPLPIAPPFYAYTPVYDVSIVFNLPTSYETTWMTGKVLSVDMPTISYEVEVE